MIIWRPDDVEPCDDCGRELRENDAWVSRWDPYSPQGVAFRCLACDQRLTRSVKDQLEQLLRWKSADKP